MIKIFLALGTIASLGSPLLPQRGIERAPITSPVENLTYNVGDIWRVNYRGDYQYPFYDIDYSIVDTTDNFSFKVIDYSLYVNNNVASLITNYYTPVALDNFYFLSYIDERDNITLYFHIELNSSDYTYSIDYSEANSINSQEISLSFDILVLVAGFSFDSSFLNELDAGVTLERIKEGGSYVAPKKSNLYRYIYDFYYSLFNEGDLTAITISGLNNMPFDSWLCHTLTIITLITGIFILFLLLRWLFKVISGFILLK